MATCSCYYYSFLIYLFYKQNYDDKSSDGETQLRYNILGTWSQLKKKPENIANKVSERYIETENEFKQGIPPLCLCSCVAWS